MEDIKINVPEGYEIDKEKSVINLEKGIVDIKFKEKVKRWRDNQYAKMDGFWISSCSLIHKYTACDNVPTNYNMFATEKQVKSALAMARISQIMANDTRFGGAISDEEWVNAAMTKYTIERSGKKIVKSVYGSSYYFLAFHTNEQRNLFLEENMDLVKQYLMID